MCVNAIYFILFKVYSCVGRDFGFCVLDYGKPEDPEKTTHLSQVTLKMIKVFPFKSIQE
jgi:hypothetical protein